MPNSAGAATLGGHTPEEVTMSTATGFAAFSSHARALPLSFTTPRPSWYMHPRLYHAAMMFFSAATE